MADNWGAPAVIVSGVGVIVTAMVGFVTWLNYRKLTSNDRAIVRLDFEQNQGMPQAIVIRLAIDNYSASTWTSLLFEIRRPKATKIATLIGVTTKRNSQRAIYENYSEAFDALKAIGPVELEGTILPAGTEGVMIFGRLAGPTDSAKRTVYVERAGLRPRQRLSMRLTLLSNDAKRRKVVVPIKRTVPDDINNAVT